MTFRSSGDTVSGALVDKALAQTYRAGLLYAVVPLPWVSDWLGFVGEAGGASFPWWRACGLPGWDFDKDGTQVDDEGNIRLCLLEPKHEGSCA